MWKNRLKFSAVSEDEVDMVSLFISEVKELLNREVNEIAPSVVVLVICVLNDLLFHKKKPTTPLLAVNRTTMKQLTAIHIAGFSRME